ncbi:MAG: sigma factor-like helix-turn-helix DNA-binding protein, partial [Bacteroidota bacterium]
EFGKVFSYQEAQRFLFIEARSITTKLPYELGSPLSIVHPPASDSSDSLFLGDHHLLQEKLETVFSVLPIRLRQILLLQRIDRKTPSEIAEILGLPVERVEEALVDALERLGPAMREAS